jgi:hypothetical protein
MPPNPTDEEMPSNPTDREDSTTHKPTARDTTDSPARSEHGKPVETIDTDVWDQVNKAHYDSERDHELVMAIVETVAEAKGVDPLAHSELPPLYNSFDAAAIEDSFFHPPGAGTNQQDGGVLTFQYSGMKVALRADGWIVVYEPR